MDNVREALFGVLAVELDLIDVAQLAAACETRAGGRGAILGDLLREWGWIDAPDQGDVERLCARRLRKADGDARRLLAERAVGRLRDAVEPLVRLGVNGDSGPGPGPNGSSGRYNRLRLHARGGIGRIWMATDAGLGREVALKELRPEKRSSRTARSRLLQEAWITGQLQHPGVVPVYELLRGDDDEPPFYTMRLVQGRTLSEAVRAFHQKLHEGSAGPRDQHELLNAFVAVCHTVAYAHSRGVIHRDLKGSNVVLGRYGEVVLLDWGLAKLVGHDDEPASAPVQPDPADVRDPTLQGKALGTPAYMAPEQAAGRLDQVDRRSDIFGLGAMLYEILTGRPPYADSDSTEELRRAREGRFEPPRRACPTAPRPLEAICLRAMAFDRDQRYPSATALADDIRSYLADEPVAVYREPVPARLGRWARRHRTAVAAAAVLLVATTVALAVTNVLVGRQRARADASLSTTLYAIDRIYEQFNQDRLAWLPKSQALQLELYGEAGRLYARLQAENPGDPVVLRHAGRAALRLAAVHRFFGRLAAAEGAYDQAVASFAQVARRGGADADLSFDLARAHGGRGELYRIGGDPRADSELRRALECFGAADAAGVEHPELRRERAGALNSLGVLRLNQGRRSEAVQAIERAVGLLRLDPDPARLPAAYQQGLVMTLVNLGHLHRTGARPSDAEAALGEAVALAERLIERTAGRPDARHLLGLALHQRGMLRESDPDRRRRAEEDFARELRLFEALAQDYPDVPNYRREQARAAAALARVRDRAGGGAAAEGLLEQAEALAARLVRECPEVPGFRVEWGVALGNRAEMALERRAWREARDRADRAVAALQAGDPHCPYLRNNLERLARACAGLDDDLEAAHALTRCLALVQADASLPASERRRLAGTYARRAIDHLRRAVRAGRVDAGRLATDPALAPLRARDDYAEFLRGFEAGEGRPVPGGP